MGSRNLGPWTTSTSLPESCMEQYDTVYRIETGDNSWYWLQQGALETSCFPSNYGGATQQFYSPARCPSGFTPACSTSDVLATGIETIHICCPTGYFYECQSTVYYEWEGTLGCVNHVSPGVTRTWTVADISGGTTTALTSEGLDGGLNAFSIQVRFQSTDFASVTSSTEGTTSTKVGSTSTSTPTPTNVSSGNDPHGSRGISTGAVVGIAVGAFAGLVLIIGTIVFFACKQRRKRGRPTHTPQPVHEMDGRPQVMEPEYQPTPSELHSTPSYVPTEIDGTPVTPKIVYR